MTINDIGIIVAVAMLTHWFWAKTQLLEKLCDYLFSTDEQE